MTFVVALKINPPQFFISPGSRGCEARMTVLLVAGVVGLWLYAVVRVLNLTGPALPPTLHARAAQSEFVQAILDSCPILKEP